MEKVALPHTLRRRGTPSAPPLCPQLEMDQAERNQHRMTIDHIEAEMKDMRKTHDKLAAQIAQQEKARDEIEAQRLNKSPNSYGKDPATLQRNLELLRMRNAALHKVHDRVSDTQSSPKEEGALAKSKIELAKLQAERNKQSLNLRQLIRQLEAAERHVEEGRQVSTGDTAATQEAYIKRLTEVSRHPCPHRPTHPRRLTFGGARV